MFSYFGIHKTFNSFHNFFRNVVDEIVSLYLSSLFALFIQTNQK